MNYSKEGKNVLSRESEINVIAYRIQNSDDIILGMTDGKFVVKTIDFIAMYSKEEMEEIYKLDIDSCDFERLGWTA